VLAAELEAEHYSRKSIRRQLRNADAFGRWLAEQQIPIADVTDAALARYTEPMHRCPGRSRARGYRPYNARGLPRLISLLRRQGVVPVQAQAVPSSPGGAEHWLQAFDHHLERVAGVSAGRRKNCLRFAHGLLQATFGDGEPDFSQLRAEHVVAFVQTRTDKRGPTSRKDPAYAVLVFLRFLTEAGLLPDP
jgi:hypothetical protein